MEGRSCVMVSWLGSRPGVGLGVEIRTLASSYPACMPGSTTTDHGLKSPLTGTRLDVGFNVLRGRLLFIAMHFTT